MSEPAARARAGTAAPRRRRGWRVAAVLAALVAIGALLLWALLPPERLARLALSRLAAANGLEVAIGDASLALRGQPTLVLREVSVREPGAGTPLLRAGRVLLSLPWSTLRDRDAAPRITRIELDAPLFDLTAASHWLATRPAREGGIAWPVLTRGLRIRDGVLLLAGGNRIEALAIELPRFAADIPLRARVGGRYAGDGPTLRFDLALALQRPAAATGLGIVGSIDAGGDGWSLPARLRLSGPLHAGDGVLRLRPAKLALSARWRSGATDLPFVLGVHGPLRVGADAVAIAPLRLVLRSDAAVVPQADAGGRIALGTRLLLELDGALQAWPPGWPALPPPPGASDSPVAFALGYFGAPSLSSATSVRLARDGAQFDGSFRLPELLEWLDAGDAGSPLPPLRGKVHADLLEVSGATLEGVEIRFDDARGPAPR